MATIAELRSCDGYTVESPEGPMGVVEETWLGGGDEPAALALRTPDGRRVLLATDAVTAVDPDAQQVLVAAGTILHGLDEPRSEEVDTSLAAFVESEPGTETRERALWQIVAFAAVLLSVLIAGEIGADFLVAYLVTGALPY